MNKSLKKQYKFEPLFLLPDYHNQSIEFIDEVVPQTPTVFKTVISRCWERIDFSKITHYEQFKRIKAEDLLNLFSQSENVEQLVTTEIYKNMVIVSEVEETKEEQQLVHDLGQSRTTTVGLEHRKNSFYFLSG